LYPDRFCRRHGALKCDGAKAVKGVVLSDRLRSLGWDARGVEQAGRAADDVVADVLARLKVLLTVR